MLINQSTLLKALLTVNKAVSTSLVIPALENYQFTITNNRLQIAANNLKFYIKTSVHVTDAEDCCIQIKASDLLNFVKELPAQQIKFAFSADKVLITYDNKGKLTLPIYDGSEFPTPEFPKTKQTAVINSDVFSEGLFKTTWAKEASRPDNQALECVNLVLSPGVVKFLTGSSKCVATHTIETEHKITADILIPEYSLAALDFPAETDLAIIVDKDKVSFQYGDTSTVITLFDAKFPDVTRFSIVADKFCTIDRSLLISTLTRLKTFAGGVNSAVTLKFGDQLVVHAENAQLGQTAEETLPADYVGDPLTIMCNCNVLITALKKLSHVHISLLGEKTVFALREEPESENRFYIAPCTA